MDFEGIVIGVDTPDPRAEQWERIARWPVPVFGLIPQPTIEMFGPSTIGNGSDGSGLRDAEVGLSYVVIRNPADRADPANLADLDEDVKRALEEVPPWPLPTWLIQQNEQQRYPMLWEAVRTDWYRDATERPALDVALVEHIAHVLNNTFRRERGLEGRPGGLTPAPDVTTTSVQYGAVLRIDGVEHSAARIDTDPHAFAIGTALDDSTLVTVVVTRDELSYLRLELTTLLATADGVR